jgi:WD40 repeat protein/serine/threonine protein kinase/tetratricopeptide (TPR) repeat protein
MSTPSVVEDLFLAALDKPPDERAAYLDEACQGDVELRRRVERLLQAHPRAEGFLEKPAADPGATVDSVVGVPATAQHPTASAESAGARIGPYKLLQLIGEGGMGSVWMAEQQEPLRRLVALKIIKAGMDSAQVIARFEAERQALALMDHPHIARVFDGGTTETGRPFFVMELVKGTPITRYCDEHRLTPHQRLELFVQVCEALQHAHQKGIIHRDLKPSNVLVAPYDGRPVVKVIDFGVAKATGQRLTEKTMFTELGAVIGTLEYMSPEQAELNNQDIDTRSDIYALGVLLYELLTGSTPLSRDRLRKAAFTEMLRLIREEEPPRPSTRLTDSKEALPSISAQRQTEPARLPRLVRGELDCIVMKALDKDRNRRYETANGLARDVQRYLADEPVEAQPPTLRYRVGKFLRRHKGPVLAGTLVLVALVGGVIGTTWSMLRADRARAAEAEQRLLADNNARTAKVAQTDAERQAEESRQRLVRLNVANGARLLDEGDLFGSLPWFVEALKHDQGDAAREAVHRIRLAAILDQCPRLAQVWFHGGQVNHIEFSPDGQTLVTAGEDGTARLWDAVTGKPLGEVMKHPLPVTRALFTPDGGRILTNCSFEPTQAEARVWDASTGRPVSAPLAYLRSENMSFSPDGRLALLRVQPKGESHTQTWLLDTTTGQLVFQKAGAGRGMALLSRDSRRLLFDEADELKLLELATGRLLPLPGAGKGKVTFQPFCAFSPDSQHLLLPSDSRAWRVWDLRTGIPVGPEVKTHTVLAAFSPDGRRVLTHNGTVARVWDVATGETVAGPMDHAHWIQQADWTSDGRHVAILTADGKRSVWDASTGKPLANSPNREPILGPSLDSVQHLGRHKVANHWDHRRRGYSPAIFSPNGLHLLTLSRDGIAQVWDLATGESITPPLKHGSAVNHGCFSPDGGRVVTACADGTLRLWDIAVLSPSVLPLDQQELWSSVFFNPDGRTLLLAHPTTRPGRWEASTSRVPLDQFVVGQTSRMQLWDIRARRPLGPAFPGSAGKVAFSANGRTVATANRCHGRFAGNTHTGRWTVLEEEGPLDDFFVEDPILSPDGRHLVYYGLTDTATGKTIANRAGCFGPDNRLYSFGRVDEKSTANELRVWDSDTGKLLSRVPVDDLAVAPGPPSLSGDGRRMLIIENDKLMSLRVVEVATGMRVGPLLQPGNPIRQAFLNADGSRVLAAYGNASRSQPGEARVWDVESGKPITPKLVYGHHALPGAFSPDGRRAALLSENGSAIQVWDVLTGEPVTPLIKHSAIITQLQFSADNRFLLTVGDKVRLWDASTGEAITPRSNEWAGTLSADGRRLFTYWSGPPRLRELTASDRPLEELELLAQVLSMSKIHRIGAPLLIDGSACRNLWAKLRPERTAPTRAQAVAWHHHSARSCAAAQEWSGAILHLGQVLKREPGAWNIYFDRGRAYSELGQYEPAIADFTQAIACRADRYESWLNRADAHFELGHPHPHWAKAAPDYEKALDLGAYEIHHWRKAALAWLATGQPDRYRSLCARLLKADKRREVKTDPHQWAWVFVLAPDALSDLRPVVKQIDSWLKSRPTDPERLLCMGAVLYRAGRFAEAEQRLQEVVNSDGMVAHLARLFLAMAQYQQKQVDKARESFFHARLPLMGQPARRAEAGASWPDRLTAQILRWEARALIDRKIRTRSNQR